MFRLTLSLLLCMLAQTSRAEIYNCNITRNAQGDWIPTRLLIDHTTGLATAEVWDPFLKYYIGKPVFADVEVENENRVTFVWGIENMTNTQKNRQFTPSLTFRATLLQPSLKLVMRSIPRGYPNSYRAVGQCETHRAE